jgi:Doubled CXXCH motif (Paired_CXXCH_1)
MRAAVRRGFNLRPVPEARRPLMADYSTDAEVWWPDGKTGIDTSQFPELYKSAKENNSFHNVRCTECHDPHGPTTNNRQIVELSYQGDLGVPVKVENNTLCLACHATHGPFAAITTADVADYNNTALKIGATVSEHSHHPYGPERSMGLSRCTNCHMATTQGPGELTLHGHTFEAIPPTKTLAYQAQGGMPNSCALSCHGGKVNSFGLGLDPNPDPTVWNDPFDKALATALAVYYGPTGTWWTTPTPTAPLTLLPSHATRPDAARGRHSTHRLAAAHNQGR